MSNSLRTDRSGAVAPLFALIALPMFLLGGVALDYTIGRNIQTRLSATADAVALSTAAMQGMDDAGLVAHATAMFTANFPDPGTTFNVEIAADRITVSALHALPTTLMRIAGIDRLDIAGRAVAARSKPVSAEIALVLDYSGSMKSNGKYETMRDSAIRMIEDLTTPGPNKPVNPDLKIGLVPFSEFVYTDMNSEFIRDVHPDKYGVKVRACLDARRHPAAIQDSTPVLADKNTKWPAPGMADLWRTAGALPGQDISTLATGASVCTTGKTEHQCSHEAHHNNVPAADFDSYVASCMSQQTLISQSDQCEKSYSTAEAAEQVGEALASDFAADSPKCDEYRTRDLVVTPLTNNYSALSNQLAAMAPARLTNIALGLEMGWHLVSQNLPFTEGAPESEKEVRKFIVLLTDGAQTVGGWAANQTFSIRQAEKNTEDLCAAIKGRNISVITVAFDLNDVPTKTRLQNCASGPDYYFEAASNTDLAAAFKDITTKFLAAVRLIE